MWKAQPGSMRAKLGNAGYALHRVGIHLGLRYGGSFYYPSADRTVLENKILPFYQLSAAHQDILFVGTDWYTQGYSRLFSDKRSFSTLDFSKGKSKYGAGRHIVDSVTNVAEHFEPSSLDLVMLNGILGWGLDRLDDADAALAGCRRCMRDGGHLLIGWNDIPKYRPFALRDIPAMRGFKALTLPPLGTPERVVDNEWRHVFSVFAAVDRATAATTDLS
jgi:SAM-dependent methyltransferase